MIKKKQVLTMVSIVVISFLLGTMFNMNFIATGGDSSPWARPRKPTKIININITDWPVERATFPENLILRGTNFGHPLNLIDETTPYPHTARAIGSAAFAELNMIYRSVWNQTFVYDKIPTKAYRILGYPVVSLTINVTNNPSADFQINFTAILGKVSLTGQWTYLSSIGSYLHTYHGKYTNIQGIATTYPQLPLDIMIDAYQRLAIRIYISGRTLLEGQTTGLHLTIFYRKHTDDFLVDIPIVENP